MIPKIIHYCWLGDGHLNSTQKKCIQSWKIQLSNYQFVKWDESRSAEISSSFYDKMLLTNCYSYASDYIRLFALYHYGGIYLDVDLEVLKPLDPLLKERVILGLEDAKIASLATCLMGSEPHHPFIKQNLDFYHKSLKLKFSFPAGLPRIMTQIAQKHWDYNLAPSELKSGIKIFPAEYFSPISFNNKAGLKRKAEYITSNTYAVHYWLHSWSWFDEPFFTALKKIPWLFMNLSDWKYVIRRLIFK